MIKHQKSKSFYDTFERKGAGQITTHYCPGCGHGTVHKLIAEALDNLDVQDRAILCSPVGCTVFAYYYFDTGNIQCSHGRAPAVATGLRRSLDDAIIMCYQGDGDLAGIGTTEIIHAANRGENITVFFVNNAIYGMTGGQMAPTTLIGQKTMTTPVGRSLSQDGAPIGLAEIMNAIKTPVYIERTSLGSPGKILKTRKAIRHAIQNQVEKRGFSFVEILSPCPINWKMDPLEARKWLVENLEPIFPVMKFRDIPEDAPPVELEPKKPWLDDKELLEYFQAPKKIPYKEKETPIEEQHVKISGFGGQGVMSAGVLLANCATAEGLNATWLPSYGPEMRGGTANASIIVSQSEIGSPVVDYPNVLIAMNSPSMDAFENKVKEGGTIIVNSSIISAKVTRSDVQAYYIPASDIASEVGLLAGANVVILTLYLLVSKIVEVETLRSIIPLSIKKKQYVEKNLMMVDKAIEYYEENYNK